MDETAGGLVVFLIVGAIIVIIVTAVVTGMVWLFLGLTYLFGHAFFVVVIFTALGAVGGLLRHVGKMGARPPTTDYDFATVGTLRMVPAHWAMLAMLSFAGAVGIYGMIFL